MRIKIPYSLLLFSFCFWLPAGLFGQTSWHKIPDLYSQNSVITLAAVQGENVYGVFRSPLSRIFTLYKSEDRGQTWRALPPLPVPLSISHITPDSSGALVLLGNVENGVSYNGPTMLRSTDEGESWTPAPGMKESLRNSFSFHIARDGSYLMVPSSADSPPALRSTDQGKTWEGIPNPDDTLLNSATMAMFQNGDIIMDCRRDITAMTYWLSTDNGATWQERREKSSYTGKTSYFYLPVGDSVYYRNKYDNPVHGESYLHRYANRETSVSEAQFLIQSFSPRNVLAIPGKPLLFAIPGFNSSNVDLHRSNDSGSTWEKMSAGSKLGISSLAATGEIVLGSARGGIYRSDDYGETWQPSGNGLTAFSDGVLLIRRNNNIVLASYQEPVQEYDAVAELWKQGISPHSSPLGLAETPDETLYLCANSGSVGYLYRRVKGDTTFGQVSRLLTATEEKEPTVQAESREAISSIAVITGQSADIVVLGLQNGNVQAFDPAAGLWREWKRPDTSASAAGEVSRIAAVGTDDLYIVQGRAIYKTAGTAMMNAVSQPPTWEKLIDLDTTVVNAFSANDRGELLLLERSGLRISRDRGQTWREVPPPSPEATYLTARIAQSGQIIASVRTGEAELTKYIVYLTNADQINWKELDNSELRGLPITEFLESQNREIYGVTGSTGIYRLELPSAVPNTESAEATRAIAEANAIFNPGTKELSLRLRLTLSGEYAIRLWDMQGREALPSQQLELSAGTHILPFNADALTSGMYRCEIVSLHDGSRQSCGAQIIR